MRRTANAPLANTKQQSDNAAKIRALLLSGIRSARLWRQLGGHRWQLIFSRRKLLDALYPRLRSTQSEDR